MLLKIDKSFQKDFEKIKSKAFNKKLKKVLLAIQKATTLEEISNLKKLKGYANCCRIRISDYRMGLIIDDKTVKLICVLHRKDIYNKFP